MLLPNSLASLAGPITVIDAIKAIYKHKSPIRRSFILCGRQTVGGFDNVLWR